VKDRRAVGVPGPGPSAGDGSGGGVPGGDVSGGGEFAAGECAAGLPEADAGGADIGEAAVFARAAALGRALEARAWMVATVESCTGGLLARAFTETAGSSAWFERGWVTYSNEAKSELVGVSAATLARHGAVSEPTAAEMAAGGLMRSRARLAIAVTGIAGPGGAVPGKPVGTVCFGWALGGRAAVCETRCFAGDRRAVRLQAAMHALRRAELLLSAEPKG
jgi:nicotinamide-nucleotide amidase